MHSLNFEGSDCHETEPLNKQIKVLVIRNEAELNNDSSEVEM